MSARDKFDLYTAVGERRADIAEYLRGWVELETAGQLNKDACERAVGALYRSHSMSAPSMVWCSNVFELTAIALTWSSTGSLKFILDNSHEDAKLAPFWQQLVTSCRAQKLQERLSVIRRFPNPVLKSDTFLGESRHLHNFFSVEAKKLYNRLSSESFPAEMIGGLALIAHELNKQRAFLDDGTIIGQRHLIEFSATRDVMQELWSEFSSVPKSAPANRAEWTLRLSPSSVDADLALWLSVWEIQKFLPYVVVLDLFSDSMVHSPNDRTWEKLRVWCNLARTGCWFLFFNDFCFVCQAPEKVVTDAFGVLHNETGPGIAFGDGYRQYFINGRPLERHVIEEPETITITEILEEDNAEIRRILIERYGLSRFILDSGARKIHEDESGALYRKDLPDDEPVVAVVVKNSTPEPDGRFKYYFLRVPPGVQTAREAVAWTFGMDKELYSPQIET